MAYFNRSNSNKCDRESIKERFEIKKGTRISCYPKGSTVDWFVNKTINKTGICKIHVVKFGEGKELEAINNDDIDYAITLEPGILSRKNMKVFKDSSKTFRFTCLFSDISTIHNTDKKDVLNKLIKYINESIGNYIIYLKKINICLLR